MSAIGDKFIFSHYLEPVSEEAAQRELDEIDAWLEAHEPLNEFKSDIKAAYAAKRRAEKVSGHHDAKEHEIVRNKNGEGNTKYGHSTTPGKDARQEANQQNAGTKVTKGSRTISSSAKHAKPAPGSATTTAADKKIRDEENKRYTKDVNNDIKSQDRARSINKLKSKVGIKPKTNSRMAGLKRHNSYELEESVREAIEEWYDENGYVIDDYEAGRIDMFVENYLNENDDFPDDKEQRELDKQVTDNQNNTTTSNNNNTNTEGCSKSKNESTDYIDIDSELFDESFFF